MPTAGHGSADISVETQLFGAAPTQAPAITTTALINAMLDSGSGISDLIFSPGRPPQVEKHGELTPVAIPQLPVLTPEDTAHVATDLIGRNEQALRALKEQGAVRPLVFAAGTRPVPRQRLPSARHLRDRHARHRVAHSDARGARTCPRRSRSIASPQERHRARHRSDRLGQVVDARRHHRLINETRADHILTIEDPIEFLHPHKKGTVHQRELHTDTPTFALALRGGAASGAEGDPRRRDARPRDDRNRADGRGDRPPRVLDAPHHRRLQDRRAHRRHLRRRAISRRSARAWRRRSATSSRSASCRRRAAAASRCWRS